MTTQKHKSVRSLALADITKATIIKDLKERYTITSKDIDTKESSRLNKELDLHKINKQK